jgi:hypothetical protein
MDQAGPDAYLNPNIYDRGNVGQVGGPFYVFLFPGSEISVDDLVETLY